MEFIPISRSATLSVFEIGLNPTPLKISSFEGFVKTKVWKIPWSKDLLRSVVTRVFVTPSPLKESSIAKHFIIFLLLEAVATIYSLFLITKE